MKLNFLAKYAEVSRLLTAPPSERHGDGRVGGFEQILHEKALDPQEKQGIRGAPPQFLNHPAPLPGEDIRARYTPIKPRLESPSIELLEPQQSDIPVAPHVKAPSIRDAKRVPSQTDWSELPIAKRMNEVKRLVDHYGAEHKVDSALGLAVVSAESAFNPNAVSKDGHESKGLFQLLDSTGKGMMERTDRSTEPYDPFNPDLNSDLGIGYLRYLHDIFSQRTELSNDTTTVPAANSSSLEKIAVAAFNAGEGRVAAAQRSAKREGKDPSRYENISMYLPDSTKDYVDRVMQYKGQFGGAVIE